MASPTAEPKLVDVDELARELVKLSANLKHYVAAEGRRIGTDLGKTYAKAADERIKANTDEFVIEIQRRDDVIAELRRQMKPLVRAADRCFRLEKAIKAAMYEGEKTVTVDALLTIMNATVDQPTAAHGAPVATIESEEN